LATASGTPCDDDLDRPRGGRDQIVTVEGSACGAVPPSPVAGSLTGACAGCQDARLSSVTCARWDASGRSERSGECETLVRMAGSFIAGLELVGAIDQYVDSTDMTDRNAVRWRRQYISGPPM